jgi:hypothetical protein
LSGYGQIWDIRYDVALSPGDKTSYEAYLVGGGTLVLTGQYSTSLNNRDDSIVDLIEIVGGSGTSALTLTTANPQQTVQPAFTSPYWVPGITYVTYPDTPLDGATTVGNGFFITEDSSYYASAIYFAPGTLTSATAGTLMVVFDTNFLNPANSDYADLENLTGNMLYLY